MKTFTDFKILLLFLIVLWDVKAQSARGPYNMDKPEDCGYVGYLEIDNTQVVLLNGRTPGLNTNILGCTLRFRAKESNTELEISFNSYSINDCDVVLLIYRNGANAAPIAYSCSNPMPGPMVTTIGEATIKLNKRNLDDRDYNYQVKVTAYKPDQSFADDNASDVNIPLIAGVVAGVVGFIILVAIICVCCYKKRNRDKPGEDVEVKTNLDADPANNSYGYSNEVARNGIVGNNGFDSPQSQKKLLGSRNKDFSAKTYPAEKKNTPLIDTRQTTIKNSAFNFDNAISPNERSVDGPAAAKKEEQSVDRPNKFPEKLQQSKPDNQPQSPTSPILNALHNNPKFRKSFQTNEDDAEKRANRISGYMSESQGSQSSVSIPESPSPPPLPKAHKVPKSPKPLRQHASIRRAFRQSSSNEEMNLSPEEYDDRHIKLIQDNDEPPSPSEIVPIKIKDPHATEPKPKHTLRPNRGKSTSTEPKTAEETLEKEIGPPSTQGGFQRNNSLRKKSAKSPRLGRSSRGSAGQELDDDVDSRPGTPTSIYSRGPRRDDDEESYSPLKRTDSRQSLYSSRSSLYGRRRRRERRGSFGESVSTYAHDDLDTSYFEFDERRMSGRMSGRRYDRGFRSMGDIVDSEMRDMREKETQTLRETATQTGKGQAIIAQPKKYVRNQSIRKASASGTSGNNAKDAALKAKQHGTKQKEKVPKESIEPKTVETQDSAVGDDPPTTPKMKPKPKPKPKPVPRKSTKDSGQEEVTNPATEKESTNTLPLNQPEVPNITTQPMMQPQFIPPGMMVQGPGGVLMQPFYPPGSPMPQGYYPMQPGMVPVYPANNQLLINQQVPVNQSTALPHPESTLRHHSASPLPPGYPSTSGKPSKSSWDMLCDITNAEKQNIPSVSETASVTGSVFSSVVPPQVTNAYYPQAYNAGYIPTISGSYQQTVPTAYATDPRVGYVPSINGRFTPAHASSGHYSPTPVSDRGLNSPAHMSPVPNTAAESTGLQRKDSWGLLKELTEQSTQSHTNSQHESIV